MLQKCKSCGFVLVNTVMYKRQWGSVSNWFWVCFLMTKFSLILMEECHTTYDILPFFVGTKYISKCQPSFFGLPVGKTNKAIHLW